MKNSIMVTFVALLVVFCCSCSSGTSAEVSSADYFKMTVDGTEINFDTQPNSNQYNTATLNHYNGKFKIILNSGFQAGSTNWNHYELEFDNNGNFLSFKRNSNAYSNYINYPAHYFNLTILALDQVNKKIKVGFSGKIYIDKENINSESNDISGEFLMSYAGDLSEPFSDLTMGPNIPQYCTAKINSNPWTAKFEGFYSIFTAEDPYKIVLHFGVNTQPGSYAINPTSTVDYIQFFKFNTQTLVYDSYDVTGVLAHSYREFHGDYDYSYIGTFNFTAVNPNNPSDTIQVTDGSFRSYQSFN